MASLRLQTREARSKLAERDEPYYQELRRGLHIGYRKGAAAGTWVLREFRGDRYAKRRLALADDRTPADGESVLSWEQAQTLALGDARPTKTKPSRYTVNQAAEDYFTVRAATGDPALDKLRYNAFIKPRLGGCAINELTAGQLQRWLAEQVTVREPREALRKAQATANRRFTVLRAILNFAYKSESGKVPSADEWRRLKPYPKADQPRQRFLSVAEAVALLGHLPADLSALARAALLTGLRLGELMALRVADVQGGAVHVQHSKSGKPRDVPLNTEGVAFFAALTKDKAAQAGVFEPMQDNSAFRVRVTRAMRAASTAAKLEPPAVFHDLRRSYGSLLLNAGASADIIRAALGHADTRMTLRTYAKMLQAPLALSIQTHLPSFAGGIPAAAKAKDKRKRAATRK